METLFHNELLASKMFVLKNGSDPVRIGYSNGRMSNASWEARSMMKSIASLKGGIRKKIGDMKDTDITEDVWLKSRRLELKSNTPPTLIWVSDLTNQVRGWNAPLIRKEFSLEYICSKHFRPSSSVSRLD